MSLGVINRLVIDLYQEKLSYDTVVLCVASLCAQWIMTCMPHRDIPDHEFYTNLDRVYLLNQFGVVSGLKAQ